MTIQTFTAEVKLRQRSAFAVQHLKAAARFSRECGDIESANVGKPLGSFFDTQIACVSATVMLCVASLESNINEYLSDSEILLPNLGGGARDQFVELLESGPILEKYERVLAARESAPFDKGAAPYQDVQLLVRIRNELVHFHPEWHDEQERHLRLGAALKGRFELSPFISEDAGVLFPQRFIGHGCTKWAVKSALQFMDDFALKVQLTSRFEKHRSECSG